MFLRIVIFIDCWRMFMFFQGSLSESILARIFNGTWHQKRLRNRSLGRPFRPKGRLLGGTVSQLERPGVDLFSGNDSFMHFGRLLAQFWHHLDLFGSVLVAFGRFLDPFWMLLAQFHINFIEFGTYLRSCFFLTLFRRKPKNEPCRCPISRHVNLQVLVCLVLCLVWGYVCVQGVLVCCCCTAWFRLFGCIFILSHVLCLLVWFCFKRFSFFGCAHH